MVLVYILGSGIRRRHHWALLKAKLWCLGLEKSIKYAKTSFSSNSEQLKQQSCENGCGVSIMCLIKISSGMAKKKASAGSGSATTTCTLRFSDLAQTLISLYGVDSQCGFFQCTMPNLMPSPRRKKQRPGFISIGQMAYFMVLIE